jgi:hypothetical protein
MGLEKKGMRQVRTNSSCLLNSIIHTPTNCARIQTQIEYWKHAPAPHDFCKGRSLPKEDHKHLDSIIAYKRAEVSALEDRIQDRKRKMIEVEDKQNRNGRMRKRVKISDLMDDLDSQLEDATNNRGVHSTLNSSQLDSQLGFST